MAIPIVAGQAEQLETASAVPPVNGRVARKDRVSELQAVFYDKAETSSATTSAADCGCLASATLCPGRIHIAL